MAHDFLHASIRRDRHRRRRAITVLSVLLIIALIAAGFAAIQQDRAQQRQRMAQEQERIATARQLVAQAVATQATDARTALQLSLAAHHIDRNGETHAGLVNTLTTTHYAGTLDGNLDSANSERLEPVELSPDLHTLGTVGKDLKVILWDVTDPAQPRPRGIPLPGHVGSILPSCVISTLLAGTAVVEPADRASVGKLAETASSR
jgi:hypothetical protein